MSRATRTAAIFAAGAFLGSAAGIAVWLVTGFQAVWFGLLLDLAAWFAVAKVADRCQRRPRPKVVDGSGYTRSGGGPAQWVNTPGIAWTVETCGNPRCTQHPYVMENSGLTFAPGTVSLTLSADPPRRGGRWR